MIRRRYCLTLIGGIAAAAAASCESRFQVRARGDGPTVVRLSLLAAHPGDSVAVVGRALRAGMDVVLGERASALSVSDPGHGTFVVPDGVSVGLTEAQVRSDGKVLRSFPFVALAADDALPVMIADASLICRGIRYRDAKGETREGTRACDAKSAVPNCAQDGAIDCLATPSFKAADMSRVVPANVRKGVTLAGVTGAYPSAQAELEGADATADLDAATFTAKIKVPSPFAWFDRTGKRHSASGDADLDAANIIAGVSIFGTDGGYVPAYPAVADVKRGVSFGGSLTGLLPEIKDCPNGKGITGANGDATTPWDGLTTGAGTVSVSNASTTVTGAGTSFDPYLSPGDDLVVGGVARRVVSIASDTSLTVDSPYPSTAAGQTYAYRAPNGDLSVDDYQNNASPSYAGAGRTPCHEGAFANVTAAAAPLKPDTSRHAAWTAIFQDAYTALHVTNVLSSGKRWTEALNVCAGLNGGTGGDGWRLPTQKELLQLYVDGISRRGASFGNTTQLFWASTSRSGNPKDGWLVKLSDGAADVLNKGDPNAVICVRP